GWLGGPRGVPRGWGGRPPVLRPRLGSRVDAWAVSICAAAVLPRPRASVVVGSELHQRVELEACQRLVRAPRGAVDEVREVASRADRERIEELVVDAHTGSLHVRSGGAEVAERERGDRGLLPEVLVEAEDRPVAAGLRLAE